MLSDLEAFICAAHAAGLGRRLSSLACEVDQAIAAYPPDVNLGYLQRLTAQRRRLASPDLALIGALAAELCDQDPEVRSVLVPIARRLAPAHPGLQRFLAHADPVSAAIGPGSRRG